MEIALRKKKKKKFIPFQDWTRFEERETTLKVESKASFLPQVWKKMLQIGNWAKKGTSGFMSNLLEPSACLH